MKLVVKLFARARDLAGHDCVEIELPDGSHVREVRGALREGYPQLAPIAASLFVAVNNDYADDEKIVGPNDEIACFPPVSGG
jgi:molybdopterin converting factor subunit 1